MADSRDEPAPYRKIPSEIISLSPSDVEQMHGDTGRFEATVSFRQRTDQTPSLTYLAVSVARAVARAAPRAQDPDAALGPERLAAARQIEELANHTPLDAAPAAVLALKDLVHDVLRLRERAVLLTTASGSAYSTLNLTEHKLIELRAHFSRLLAAVARATTAADGVLLDEHAAHATRIAAAEAALGGGLRSGESLPPDAEELRRRLLDVEQEAASARRLHQQSENEIAHLRAELATAHRLLSDTGASDRRIAEAEATAKVATTARDEAEARAALLVDELARTTEERNRLVAEATKQSEELSRLRAAKRDSQALSDALIRVGELEEQLAEAETRAPTQTINSELDELRAAKRDTQILSDALARVGALEEQMFIEKELAERHVANLNEQLALVNAEREAAARLRAEAQADLDAIQQTRTEQAARTEQVRDETSALERQLAQSQAEIARLREAATHSADGNDAARAELAAALERQLGEVEDRRASQAADYEQRLAAITAEVAQHREAADRLQAAAQRAADARARLAAATAAAQVRLAVAGEEAGLDAVPTVLRACADSLRALPPDGDGDDTPALAALEAATAAVAGVLVSTQQTLDQIRTTAHTSGSEAEAANQRAAHAIARAEAAELRVAEAEGRCDAALQARDQAHAEAQRLEARLSDSATALANAQDEAVSAAAEAASQLRTARYEAAALLVRAETGERERDGARSDVDLLTRDLALNAEAANQLHALLRGLAATAGLEDGLPDEALAACADGSAAEAAAALERRLATAGDRLPELETAVTEARASLAAAREQLAVLERELAGLAQARDSALADWSGAQAEAASLQTELEAARAQLAERTAELASAREQLAVTTSEMSALRCEAERVPALGGELRTLSQAQDELSARLAGETARAAAAEAAVDQLLDAARAAASAAAAALDRFGLLGPGDSRRLTRATVRLDQAEDSVAASAGLGHELIDRAVLQIESFADRYKTIDLERLEQRERILTLDADLAAARAETAAIDERLAAAERTAADLPAAEERITALSADLAALRGRLDEAQRAAENDRRDAAVAHAAALAEAESRSDNAQAAVEEAVARTAQALAAAEAATCAADEAAARLAALEAEAAARMTAAEAALDEREAQIAELAAALAQARSERGETVGLAARLRVLDQRLAEAQRENARLSAERSLPSAADPATAAALHAAEHRIRGLEAALAEERIRAEALVRARERSASEWQLRLDRVLAELSAERDRLADQETALANARAELAGAKARLRSLTSSEPTR